MADFVIFNECPYIADKKSSLPRPIKELKGFQKVQLAPGETQYVSFIVDQNSLSYFNDTLHKWIAEAGEFEAIIGSSCNHSIFRHDNFIGCFSADKIKMSARK
ncbi:MAG: fibronectin type III-like domain-contianing protein [Phocaeicola sp.]